jgi:hypothetical protein
LAAPSFLDQSGQRGNHQKQEQPPGVITVWLRLQFCLQFDHAPRAIARKNRLEGSSSDARRTPDLIRGLTGRKGLRQDAATDSSDDTQANEATRHLDRHHARDFSEAGFFSAGPGECAGSALAPSLAYANPVFTRSK